MTNPCISRVSNDFFFAAALLALFGTAALHNAGPHGALQLSLAVLMGGAGMYVRTGTAEARVIGLAAAAVVVAVGGYAVVFGNDYIVGTIIAIFAVFRLWSAGKQVIVMQPVAAVSPTQPMAAFDAPQTYGGGAAVPAQPTAPLPQAPFFPATESVAFLPAPPRRTDDPA
jgi:hypothetical protein